MKSIKNWATKQTPRAGAALLVLLAVTFIFYDQVKDFSFISYDDERYVTENPDVRDLSLDGIHTILFNPTVYEENKPPLSVLSLAVNYYFSQNNPAGYHLTNLFIHLLNIALVFFLVRTVSRSNTAALFVSAVFALHPSASEAVAWVSSRKELQYTFFYLIALLLSLKYWRTGNFKLYIAVIPVFLLSYYSKYAAASFPVLYLALSFFYQNRKSALRVIAESIPFFLLPLYSVYLMTSGVKEKEPVPESTPSVYDDTAETVSNNVPEITEQTVAVTQAAVTEYHAFDLIQKIFLGGYSFIKYLLKFIWPFDQQLIYPYPRLENGSLPGEYYIFTAISVLLVLAAGYFFYKNKVFLRGYLGFGVLLFLVKSAMLLHVLPIGGRVVIADRYMYMPYIGLAMVLFFAATRIAQKARIPALKYVLLGLYSAATMFQLHNRLPDWRDTPSIFTDLTEKNVPSQVAFNNLGNYYHEKGVIRKAEQLFDQSLDLDPDYVDALNNRGSLLLNSGRLEEAERDFRRVIEMYPDYKLVHYNLGIIHQRLQNYDSAVYHLERVVSLDYMFYHAHNNLGIIYMNTAEYERAREAFKHVLHIKPDYVNGHTNMGFLHRVGFQDYKTASYHFEKALEVKPDHVEAAMGLALNYRDTGKPEKAIEQYSRVIQRHPNYSQAYLSRGLLYLELNEQNKGCEDFHRAAGMGNANAQAIAAENCVGLEN